MQHERNGLRLHAAYPDRQHVARLRIAEDDDRRTRPAVYANGRKLDGNRIGTAAALRADAGASVQWGNGQNSDKANSLDSVLMCD